MSFVFNVQTVSTMRHCYCSSLSGPGIVGCENKVNERVKRTTFVPGTKKKE
jgi:hypothetical protein